MNANTPLAQRMRPKQLDEMIGQSHLLADDAPISRMVKQGYLASMILHGEAGIGKTTMATLLAQAVNRPFYALSAISAGVKEVRELLAKTQKQITSSQQNTQTNIQQQTQQQTQNLDFFADDIDAAMQGGAPVVFIDEIHRFNKSQQDALLGAVELGNITLIGATTENPSFSVNNALLSRCQVYRLQPLTDEQILAILERAIAEDALLKTLNVQLATTAISQFASGDARKALNILELAVHTANCATANDCSHPEINTDDNTNHNTNDSVDNKAAIITIDDALIAQVAQTALSRYDKTGDNHYDMVSAMIKSIRGSDTDASLYWLARMLVAGEDATFIARRLVIAASEDIGNANPNALLLADAALRSVQAIGMPEARIILGQVVVYLANCAKSNSTYQAINKAMALAKNDHSAVPLHLRNGVTAQMRAEGHGKDYRYPHDYPNHYCQQQYLPTHLMGTQFYEHADNRREQHSKAFIEWLKNSEANHNK